MSCENTINPKKQITIDEFIGSYTFEHTSYKVPLDAAGNEIATEKHSLENEIIQLSKGMGDTLIFESPSLVRIKGKGDVKDQTIRVNIPEQEYFGNDLDPSGLNTIKTHDPIILEKKDEGKKRLYSDAKVYKPVAMSRIRFPSGFK